MLILERGDWLPREIENWDATAVFVDNRYVSADTWYDKDGRAFQPQVHYFVGGATKFYGAALYRLREQDFGELRHHGGISPAWPVGYDVFEPYYAQAEELYQVHGVRGEDPTDPPGRRRTRSRRCRTSRASSELFDDLAGWGCTRSTLPTGSCSTRRTPPSARASAAPPATGSPACCTPSPTPT